MNSVQECQELENHKVKSASESARGRTYREKGLSSLGYKLEEWPAGWRSNIQILIWDILGCQINEKTTEGSHL